MSMVMHARRLDGTVVPVALAQFYWPYIDEGIIPEAHLCQEVFVGCDIVLLSQGKFDAFQGTLAQIHEKVKSVSSKKGFDDSFLWHKHTNYSESFLHSQGFGTLTKSTLVAIDNGTGRFEIAFLFLREKSIDGTAMKDLCDYMYQRNRPGKRARGDSFVQDRGDKTMSGKMDVFGSWDAFGPSSVGLGKGKMEVRAYNPNGSVDPSLNALVVAHADQLTAMEKALVPSCAAMRASLAANLDPHGNHRISPDCDAFSMPISVNYIADPHDDSGVRGVLELIQFVNATGPLPPGHKWLFAIAGFLCELPTAVGESAIIALPACGVFHGTLPTSSTSPTHHHGNYGSALVTKKPICKGLARQLQCGRATHPRYRSSYLYFNGAAERPEFTCEHCRVFEGTEEEVEEHEECCELKP